jgi:hypothetical protein
MSVAMGSRTLILCSLRHFRHVQTMYAYSQTIQLPKPSHIRFLSTSSLVSRSSLMHSSCANFRTLLTAYLADVSSRRLATGIIMLLASWYLASTTQKENPRADPGTNLDRRKKCCGEGKKGEDSKGHLPPHPAARSIHGCLHREVSDCRCRKTANVTCLCK